MFRVSGNQISITAGDTALMAICPDETGYVPTANDRAIFTVRDDCAGRGRAVCRLL